MSTQNLFRWGRVLVFVGLAILCLGFLLRIRHWPYGSELTLLAEVILGIALIMLLLHVLLPKKNSNT